VKAPPASDATRVLMNRRKGERVNHMKQIYERLDIVNCYHEAGHAVMALVLGADFQYVELAHPSQDGGNGFGRSARNGIVDNESQVLIKFAGVGAELIQRNMGQAWSFLFASSGRSDWKQSQLCIKWMGGDKRRVIKELKAKTTQLLKDNWAWVTCVAEAIREKRFVGCEDVLALRP